MSRKKTKGNEPGPLDESTAVQDSHPADGPDRNGTVGEVFALPSALTIHGVRELKSALLQRATDPALIVAIDRIVDVDTAGVQLLLALRRSRMQDGRPLEWRGES